MKKITFLLTFLIATVGFAQTNLEDFEGTPSIEGFEGLGSATIVANPSVDGNNGSANVLELVVTQAGNPWQGANVNMQTNYIDVTTPASQQVTMQVYSTTSFNLLARLAVGQSGAVDSAADAAHTGSGWETLTFTFNENLDGTASANGEYGRIALFPNWNGGGWHDPEIEITVYVDNITGIAGGSLVSDPIPATAAPVPTTGDATVYSIYNDTNGYTTNFNVQYTFGTGGQGDVDLDPDGGIVNNGLKLNFGLGGFGQGEGGPDDVSSYDFVNFNYWASSGLAGFRFVMIDNDGVVQEFEYEFGSVGSGDEADIVTESWQLVSIPMSYFTGLGFDSTAFFQWKVDPYMQSVTNTGIVYFDNIILTRDFPLSRDEFSSFESKVYPNPSSNSWTISTPNNTIRSVQVFNVLGRQVVSQTFDSNEAVIPVQSLASGIYLARVTTDTGTKTMKLIRE